MVFMDTLNYHFGVIKKQTLTIVLVLEMFLAPLSFAQRNANKQSLPIYFYDSVSINNPIIIDFFKNYLYQYKDATRYKGVPIIVCHINKNEDTLVLTLSGHGDYDFIFETFGLPNAYIKINNKVILIDFGIGKVVESSMDTNKILIKLGLNSLNRVEGAVYFFTAWQLRYIDKDNYIIKKGVMPPGSPPIFELPDSVIYIPPLPQSY